MILNSKFNVSIYQEKNSVRLYINHPSFSSRIKCRLGSGRIEDFTLVQSEIQLALSKNFKRKQVIKDEVEFYVNDFIDLNYRSKGNIFNYVDEFINIKRDLVNSKRKRNIDESTIQKYTYDIGLFDKYLKAKKLSSHPAYINRDVLDNFYIHLKIKYNLSHNTIVKKHDRVKNFIKFLSKKSIGINPNYEDSIFLQEYDHLEVNDDDRALTPNQVQKLIELKRQIDNNSIIWKQPKYRKNISESIRQRQLEAKKIGVKETLDFWLWCCGTGMYYSDVKHKALTISTKRNGHKTLKYRREKNNSLCSGILLRTTDYFIIPELIEEYSISNGSNFPITLSDVKLRKWLKEISHLVGFDFTIKPKFARKTFASIWYFEYQAPLNLVSKLLGHSNERETMHYLRITEDDFSEQLSRLIV